MLTGKKKLDKLYKSNFGGGGGIRTHASLTAQGFSKPSQLTGLCDASSFRNYTSSEVN